MPHPVRHHFVPGTPSLGALPQEAITLLQAFYSQVMHRECAWPCFMHRTLSRTLLHTLPRTVLS